MFIDIKKNIKDEMKINPFLSLLIFQISNYIRKVSYYNKISI